MKDLAAISLDQLAHSPEDVTDLPMEYVEILSNKAMTVLNAIMLRRSRETSVRPPVDPELLTAEGVGHIIGKSKSWVNKNRDFLPQRRQVGDKPMWLRSEILKWVKARPAWGEN